MNVCQPAVLDNLLTSMKFVLHGMGVLRINLATSRNKVRLRALLFQVVSTDFTGFLHCTQTTTEGRRSC